MPIQHAYIWPTYFRIIYLSPQRLEAGKASLIDSVEGAFYGGTVLNSHPPYLSFTIIHRFLHHRKGDFHPENIVTCLEGDKEAFDSLYRG